MTKSHQLHRKKAIHMMLRRPKLKRLYYEVMTPLLDYVADMLTARNKHQAIPSLPQRAVGVDKLQR